MIDLITTFAKHHIQTMEALSLCVKDSTIIDINRVYDTKSEACVCWGVRHLDMLKRHYKKVIVVERGYFNDRMKYYSLGVGGLNGRADFRNFNRQSDRWLKHGSDVKDWKKGGNYYLVMGQVDGDQSIKNVDINGWYQKITNEILEKTDKPVYFRAHPQSRQHVGALSTMGGSLDDALDNACGVITYNSNSGVDAVLAGVPTMTQDMGSMAWGVTAHNINQLLDFSYPDRSQWLYNLAYTQWTLEELKDGTAWSHLCH